MGIVHAGVCLASCQNSFISEPDFMIRHKRLSALETVDRGFERQSTLVGD
ncbi:hypothetical protein PCH70_13930 [Pseudomonas cichorii JBC1]|nr:hypothetical protein PCH70_13930 [Pseudomonas cichorii JBC1]